MWMLTKMAMIFFILALALVLVGLSAKEKAGLCEARANGVVQNIRSQVVGIVSAPIEDERKIIPLERVLATGSEDFQQYNLTITWRNTTDGQSLAFEALAASKKCRSGSFLLLPDYVVHFVSEPKQASGGAWVMTAEPSKRYGGKTPPSLYIIVLKCSTKEWPFEKHLFLEVCGNNEPNTCLLDFNKADIDKCCGWSNKIGGVVSPDCKNTYTLLK